MARCKNCGRTIDGGWGAAAGYCSACTEAVKNAAYSEGARRKASGANAGINAILYGIVGIIFFIVVCYAVCKS